MDIKDIVNNTHIYGLENTMRVAKFPMYADINYIRLDDDRLKKLANTNIGEGHDNALMGIIVQFDLTFTNKAWVEAERYHFFDIVSSQSTMHRITKMNLDSCYCEYVDSSIIERMKKMVEEYNTIDEWWNDMSQMSKEEWKKDRYLRILYSNPSGMKLTAGITTNYRQLKTIYKQRKNHGLPEWREFCKWIETLPYSELITGELITLDKTIGG